MRKVLVVAAVVAACSAVSAVAPGFAQEDAAEARATSFQAVQGAVTEDIPGAPLLLVSYALIWLGLLGYVWRVARLQAQAAAQLADLSRQIEAQAGQSRPAD